MACGKMMMARMTMGTAQLINRGNASINSMAVFFQLFRRYSNFEFHFGFTFNVNPCTLAISTG